MHYTLNFRTEAYHKPTETWHIYEQTHGLRAVSRKHALSKALKVVTGWPAYMDRVNDQDWQVDAEARIVENND